MTRLADMILQTSQTSLGAYYKSLNLCGGAREVPRADVPDGLPVYVADDICELFYAGTSKETWDIRTDFERCLPPEPDLFLEMCRPSHIVSETMGTLPSTGFPSHWGWFITYRKSGDIPQKRNRELAAKERDRLLETTRDHIDMESVSRVINSSDPTTAASTLNTAEQRVLAATLLAGDEVSLSGNCNLGRPSEVREWVMWATLIRTGARELSVAAPTIELHMDSSGTVVSPPAFLFRASKSLSSMELHGIQHASMTLLHPALLAFSMSNLGYAAITTKMPASELRRRHERRGRPALVAYRSIAMKPGCKL
jgi:hypothetical protein